MKVKLNWGNGLILFFLIFFTWVFWFVYFAMQQNTDLVADDYYQKGAKYTEQMEIDSRSVAYQDSLQITKSGSQVKIILSKELASSGDSIFVYFFRSSDKLKDLRIGCKATGSPLLIDSKQLVHGRYQVFITWHTANKKYGLTKNIDIE